MGFAPGIKAPGAVAASVHGDYSGSIYVQTHRGQTARWKLPELEDVKNGVSDAGWHANRGHASFFENAAVTDIADKDITNQVAQKMKDYKAAGHRADWSEYHAQIDSGAHVSAASGKEMLGRNILEYNRETIDEAGPRLYHSGGSVFDVYESTGERHFYKGDTTTNLRGDVASESIDDFMSRRGLPSASVAFDNANKVETLASEYDTGAKSADLADGGTASVGTREARRDTVIDSLLKDENHPDPAKAEFNRRWNEQVLKDSAAPTNKAAPFGGMSDKAIEADIYNEAKSANLVDEVDLSTLSDEDLAASKARVEKQLMDLEVESKKTNETIAELKKQRGAGRPKPGTIIINADGTQTVVKPEPLNPVMKADDLAKRATSAATGATTATSSPAASAASAASTVSGGGALRAPAVVASTSVPGATAAARTAASVTAPTAARSTRGLVGNALEVGQKLTRGHLGATALGVAAAGLLFGYANRDED
jgi:hypothetical protein